MFVAAVAIAVAVAWPASDRLSADEAVLALRANVIGAAGAGPVTIELMRWSTDAERTPLLTALAPPPAPPAAGRAAGAPAEAGRGAAAAAGRGAPAGRGGRGGRGGNAPPASPAVRLSAAVKAAPTLGFIWGDGPTGYSIKYAWRAAQPDGTERLVLVTERRLGAHAPAWPPAARTPDDEDYTVIEMRIDAKGSGEAKSSLATAVVVDADAKTLALEGYAAAPALLKVTR